MIQIVDKNHISKRMLEQLAPSQMLIDVKLFHILVQEIPLIPPLKDQSPGVDKLKTRLLMVRKLVKIGKFMNL